MKAWRTRSVRVAGGAWPGSWLAAGGLLSSGLLSSGCGDVCESAAQICADERRVAAPIGDTEPVTCEGDLERHATCIEEAESCAPDVVEACWNSAAAEGAAP